jgi:hypothetical protein
MTSKGQIAFKAILKMLEECAPGFSMMPRTHNFVVTYRDRTYHRLPRGPHGKRKNFPVQMGHVRNLVRTLEIHECAQRVLEQLR